MFFLYFLFSLVTVTLRARVTLLVPTWAVVPVWSVTLLPISSIGQMVIASACYSRTLISEYLFLSIELLWLQKSFNEKSPYLLMLSEFVTILFEMIAVSHGASSHQSLLAKIKENCFHPNILMYYELIEILQLGNKLRVK